MKTDRIRVLLVDDHALMRDGVRVLLEVQQNIEIVGEASEGHEAFEKVISLVPDVVIMDIRMPGLDGLETTRRIKKHNPAVKILILTQYDNKGHLLSAIKAGASGYMPKRALGEDLVTAVLAIYDGGSFLYPSVASELIDFYQHDQPDNTDFYDFLTDKQKEVFKLLAEGRSCKEIAEAFFLSPKTIYGLRAGIMKKLGLHNRTELVKYAIRKGLVNLDSKPVQQ